jgi:K+-transporting ATPase KdpF subunit
MWTESFEYLIGAVISIFIMGYLVYSLLYPEKF